MTDDRVRELALRAVKEGHSVESVIRTAIRETAEECARVCEERASIEGIAQRCAAAIRERFK